MDGNHKLIRWRMVIHGCIDGFSRTVVFLKCSNNNRAATVHKCFLEAIERFRLPIRIRSDHGTENIEVARTMLELRGVDSKPVLTGKSVHNQRIERLWVDVGFQVIQKYKDIFFCLESEHDLNPSDDVHLYALHFVYLPRISRSLTEFTESWNNHPIRTSKNQTPLQLWSMGFYESEQNLLQITDLHSYGIDWDGPTPDIETQNNVVVPEVEIDLTNDQIVYLKEHFDPLRDDDNCGINIFCDVMTYIQHCLCSS